VGEQHRRLAEHRKTLHGGLANRLLAHGADIACEKINYLAWQKNFPRSVRDRAPGLLVEVMRRKAESVGGDHLYECTTRTTALSQTCLCGNRKKGEAADIRRRGGQRRVSKPGVKPKPRCDRAGRRELPLPTSPRR
jgi:hypothetical protein